MIAENIREVHRRIEGACARVGRNPEEITLIAVSKTKPASLLEEALNAGQVDFGENKVQEILEKSQVLPANIRWHMIGHLQRNKVKQVIDHITLIHSVDSYRLLTQINMEAGKIGRKIPILLEVNVAEEESKYGFHFDEIEGILLKMKEFPQIHVDGLMTIAPYVANAEENRQFFKKMYQLLIDMKSKNIDNVNMSTLSMGMTNDYEVAIEEGATMVRVGTGIFGIR